MTVYELWTAWVQSMAGRERPVWMPENDEIVTGNFQSENTIESVGKVRFGELMKKLTPFCCVVNAGKPDMNCLTDDKGAVLFSSEQEARDAGGVPMRAIGVCKQCGRPLFPAFNGGGHNGYRSQCFTCDSDFFSFEQETPLYDEFYSGDDAPKLFGKRPWDPSPVVYVYYEYDDSTCCPVQKLEVFVGEDGEAAGEAYLRQRVEACMGMRWEDLAEDAKKYPDDIVTNGYVRIGSADGTKYFVLEEKEPQGGCL